MNRIKGQRGSITVDFIFGIVLVAGVSFILVSLCFTMAIVEISQYIAFASSRSYFGGHKSEKDQIDLGDAKYNKILSVSSLKQLLNGDWFGLKYMGTRDFRDMYPSNGLEHDNDTFFGTRLELEAKLLNMRIPFLGTTAGNGYKASLTSYLGREPNVDECLEFNKNRLSTFSQRYPLAGPSAGGPADVYAVISDNGC